MKRPLRWLVGIGVLASATGCSGDNLTPSSTTALLEVTPSGGAADVAPDGVITIRFSGPMGMGMEQYVDLHQGTINGPVVPMSCTWSADRTALTCVPSPALQDQSPYALHMGTGMMDAEGHGVVMEDQGVRMGGEPVTSGMMAGMHAGQPVNAMGPGWGHFGLAFGFTTR
jgi:hypothetical protein